MMTRILSRRPFDLFLNVVFVVWVMYFVITGYVIPRPLIRHATRPPVIEQHQTEPAAPDNAPVLVVDQDS
jgi:hypothetical protein